MSINEIITERLENYRESIRENFQPFIEEYRVNGLSHDLEETFVKEVRGYGYNRPKSIFGDILTLNEVISQAQQNIVNRRFSNDLPRFEYESGIVNASNIIFGEYALQRNVALLNEDQISRVERLEEMTEKFERNTRKVISLLSDYFSREKQDHDRLHNYLSFFIKTIENPITETNIGDINHGFEIWESGICTRHS